MLTATGELKISGTAAAPVVLASNAVTPARGSWSGEAELIATLLDSASLKVRQAALHVLRSPYLPAEAILTRARKLLHDSDPEIRERARRLLGTEAGSTS